MHSSAVAVVAQLRTTRNLLLVVAVAAALLVSALPGSVARVRGAEPAPLKAVFIVGPTDGLTDSNLVDAEALAVEAEAWGMDVRRVFFPHATWENVLANIQGANLVVYMGHGYGWPSPYTQQLTESRQNGMGLNSFDGSGKSQYTYYGANVLKANVVLAPNAIVFLNHLCYSAGNGEPGMAVPSWDVARQRVDNMANGWLATGAKTVFAYSSQPFTKALRALFTTDCDDGPDLPPAGLQAQVVLRLDRLGSALLRLRAHPGRPPVHGPRAHGRLLSCRDRRPGHDRRSVGGRHRRRRRTESQ